MINNNISSEVTMVSDAEAPDVPEQPILIEDYSGSEGLSITGYDKQTIYIPYRLVKEVTKVMLGYANTKKS